MYQGFSGSGIYLLTNSLILMVLVNDFLGAAIIGACQTNFR